MAQVELKNVCIHVNIGANIGSEKLWKKKHCYLCCSLSSMT